MSATALKVMRLLDISTGGLQDRKEKWRTKCDTATRWWDDWFLLTRHWPLRSISRRQVCFDCRREHLPWDFSEAQNVTTKPKYCLIADLEDAIVGARDVHALIQEAAAAKFQPFLDSKSASLTSLRLTLDESLATSLAEEAASHLLPSTTFPWLVEDAIVAGNLTVMEWLLENKSMVETHGCKECRCRVAITPLELSKFLSIAAANHQMGIFRWLRRNIMYLTGPIALDDAIFLDFAVTANESWMTGVSKNVVGRLDISYELLQSFLSVHKRLILLKSNSYASPESVAFCARFANAIQLWREGMMTVRGIFDDCLPKTLIRILSGVMVADAMRRATPSLDPTCPVNLQRFREDITNWYLQVPDIDKPLFRELAKFIWAWTPECREVQDTFQQRDLLRTFRFQLGELVSRDNDAVSDDVSDKPSGGESSTGGHSANTHESWPNLLHNTRDNEDHNFRDKDPPDDTGLDPDLVLLLTGAIFAAILAFLILSQFGISVLDQVLLAMTTFDVEDQFSADVCVNIRLVGLFLSLVWTSPASVPKTCAHARNHEISAASLSAEAVGTSTSTAPSTETPESSLEMDFNEPMLGTQDLLHLSLESADLMADGLHGTSRASPSLGLNAFDPTINDTTLEAPSNIGTWDFHLQSPPQPRALDATTHRSLSSTPSTTPATSNNPTPSHRCPNCHKSYSNLGNLNKHVNHHCLKGKRAAFVCDHGCGRKFTQKHYMKRHMQEFCSRRGAGGAIRV